MYGWRGRVGLIIPSSNTTMEPEFYSLMPVGVSVHTTRVPLREVTSEELIRMEEKAVEAAELLATADVDIIVYGCTTGSLVKGPGHDEEIARRLSKASGKPVLPTATAVIEALRALRAKRIALVTPYIDEVNEREIKFLEHHGVQVEELRSFRIKANIEIGKLEPYQVYRLAREVRRDLDAVFISCTNLRTIEVIDALEKDLGLPVFSSNTATVWATLRRLGVREVGMAVGRLLKELL
ncbi:MAG: aspartate/glutamate racemase family protein [Pyrodictiaceae archaeon]